MSGCSRVEQRLQNCCNQKPMGPSGVFLKKTPPFAATEMASEFWSRSKTLRCQRGDAGSTPAGRSMILIQECVFAGVAERGMHLIRNEDNAGSIPAASSRKVSEAV